MLFTSFFNAIDEFFRIFYCFFAKNRSFSMNCSKDVA